MITGEFHEGEVDVCNRGCRCGSCGGWVDCGSWGRPRAVRFTNVRYALGDGGGDRHHDHDGAVCAADTGRNPAGDGDYARGLRDPVSEPVRAGQLGPAGGWAWPRCPVMLGSPIPVTVAVCSVRVAWIVTSSPTAKGGVAATPAAAIT